MPRSKAAKPSLPKVLQAVRVSRESGDLGTARRAFRHLFERWDEVPGKAQGEVALEGEHLAKELVIRGAHLGGLEACLCAHSMGRDQTRNFDRISARYARWRPTPGPIGAAKDGLLAGASGTFLSGTKADTGRPQQARIVSLSGGITGTGTEAFRRILSLAHEGVDWLLLDAVDLSYVGSSGLAIVVKSAEQLRGEAGGVVLFQPSSNLKLLVETLGLGNSLHPVEDLTAALLLIHGA